MKLLKVSACLLLVTVFPRLASALLVGPYTPDANTLFLMHFNEAAGGSVTTNVGSKGGNFYTVTNTTAGNGLAAPPAVTTLLGYTSYSTINPSNSVNFGSAVAGTNNDGLIDGVIGYDFNRNGAYDADVSAGPASADALAMTNLNIGNGGQTSFTIEALICPTAIGGSVNQEIACSDDANGSRGFQFKITTTGTLQFQFINPAGLSVSPAIPTTGPHAFVAGAWFHVAAVYNGTAGTMTIYWTRVDPSINADNPIGSASGWAVGTTYGAVVAPLVIGAENRGSAQESFKGLIDEVRISSVARAANGMQFFSPSVTISQNPFSQNIDYGQPVNFSVSASSLTSLGYQWRFNSNSITGATNTSYSIPAVSSANAGYYDVVVTNTSGNASTSSPALLVIGAVNYLAHRWSFTNDTTDSIGGATGTNFGDASVSGGALVLDGVTGTYMQLPSGLFHNVQAATFDFWATYGTISGNNDRVFDFGNTNGIALGVGGQPNNYLFYSPHSGTANRLTGTGSTSEFEQTTTANGVLDGLTLHITCIVDPPDQLEAIYTNGVLESVNTNFTIAFSSLNDQLAYVGRSLFDVLSGDAYLNANIDELRMYNGALSPNSILVSDAAGPNGLLSDGPVVFLASPSSASVPQNQTVTFTSLANGRQPILYQWLKNNVPIPGATNNTFSYAPTFADNTATFQVLATNNVNGTNYSAASGPATLTVVVPSNLAWLGASDNHWNLSSLNWSNAAQSLVAYTQFDGAIFDDRGAGQPNVDLQFIAQPTEMTVSNALASYQLSSLSGNGSLAVFSTLLKQGSGQFILDVTNNSTGPVVVQGGTLQVGNFDTTGSLGTGPVTNNATLQFNRNDGLGVPNDLHGTGQFIVNAGSVTPTSTNIDYTGSTIVNGGILFAANNLALGTTASGTTVNNSGQVYITANVNFGLEAISLSGSGDGNGALRKGGAGATIYNGPVTLAADSAIGVDGNATLTLSNTVSGPAALTALGTGTLTLTTNNSFTGGFILNGPIINVNTAHALSTGPITVSGAGRFILGTGITFTNAVTASTVSPGTATGLLMVNDNTNNIITTVSGPLEFDNTPANGNDFLGPITSGYLNVTGPVTNAATGVVGSRNGFVRFSGGGNYSSFTLNQGTASIGANDGLCTNATVTMSGSGGSTVNLNGFNQTLTGLIDGVTPANVEMVTNSGASLSTLTLNLTTFDTFSGVIGGNLALVVNGSGTLLLAGTNAYTGNTTVNGGTLELAQPAFAATSTITVASGAFLQMDFTTTNTVAGLVLNGASQPAGVYNNASSSAFFLGAGSLLVNPVATNPTNIVVKVNGNNLNLSWPADHTGWRLLVQTNNLAKGISPNLSDWGTVAGSAATNQVNITIDPAKPTEFYRLTYP